MSGDNKNHAGCRTPPQFAVLKLGIHWLEYLVTPALLRCSVKALNDSLNLYHPMVCQFPLREEVTSTSSKTLSVRSLIIVQVPLSYNYGSATIGQHFSCYHSPASCSVAVPSIAVRHPNQLRRIHNRPAVHRSGYSRSYDSRHYERMLPHRW